MWRRTMKKGIIVTSFGTSNRETMELCIESKKVIQII
jgi:cobalamin biosynthesis Co2+ chelatase CbiK